MEYTDIALSLLCKGTIFVKNHRKILNFHLFECFY